MYPKQPKSKQYAGQKHIANPEWRYVPAAATNIAETFARIRAEMQAESNRKTDTKVSQIKRRGI